MALDTGVLTGTADGSVVSNAGSSGGGGYPADIFVRGNFNAWGTADPMSFDGTSLYSVDIDLDAGMWEFKIASDDWATVDLGAGDGGDTTVLLDTARLIGPGPFGNLLLGIATGGVYTFLLDLSSGADSPTLTVRAVTVMGEPATLALLGLSLAGLFAARRRLARG